MIAASTQTINSEAIPTVSRNLNLFNQTLFGFSVSLSGMSKTISINWNKFNFSQESLALLKRSRVKLSNIPVFQKLDDYALRLNRYKAEIEQRTLFVSGQRVVTSNQINNALVEVQELKQLANGLREELRNDYEQGKAEFRDRIASLLATPEFLIPLDQQSQKVDEICQSFISLSDIDYLLQVKLEVFRIPALNEQIEEQAQLREQVNRLKAAQRQEQAENALNQAQAEALNRSRELRENIFAKAKEEIESIIAEQISAITSYEVDVPETNSNAKIEAHYKRNRKIREKLARHIKRMQVLADVGLSGNVDEAVLKLEQLGQVMGTAVEKTSLEQTLSKLQDELKSSLVVISQVDTPLLESVPNLI